MCPRASEVTITLKNRGDEAYKHDIYGDSITISRRFDSKGSSTYKIKAKDGTQVSNKREELSAICDHMNIQVDNPMNVLTQGSIVCCPSREILSYLPHTDSARHANSNPLSLVDLLSHASQTIPERFASLGEIPG